LGWQLGLARAVGAVFFAVVTGLLMALIFSKDDASRTEGQIYVPESDAKERTLLQDALYILTMVLILIFAAFAKPTPGSTGLWPVIFAAKWYITIFLLIFLGIMLKAWFTKDECKNWVESS
jgi:cytochrome c biogenesis factor